MNYDEAKSPVFFLLLYLHLCSTAGPCFSFNVTRPSLSSRFSKTPQVPEYFPIFFLISKILSLIYIIPLLYVHINIRFIFSMIPFEKIPLKDPNHELVYLRKIILLPKKDFYFRKILVLYHSHQADQVVCWGFPVGFAPLGKQPPPGLQAGFGIFLWSLSFNLSGLGDVTVNDVTAQKVLRWFGADKQHHHKLDHVFFRRT